MEEFRDIWIIKWVDYTWLYQASNYGRIKSLSRIVNSCYNSTQTIQEKILKYDYKRYWYLSVKLCKNNKAKHYQVHRLVWLAFLGLKDDSKILVCHKDDNPQNNHKDNLFLWTQKDNMQDMVKKWRHWIAWIFWALHASAIKINQYTKDWEFIKTWGSIIDIQTELWINSWNICSCCRWREKYKTAWGYKWEYFNK